jgi:dicarboxylate transporter 10
MFEILKESLRKEGARFLFKGWTPAFMRLGPNTVLLFVFMEVCLYVHFIRVTECLTPHLQQLKKAWRASLSS